MSGYVWGLLTLPIALAALFACVVVVKGGYLLLGLLGKVGVVRYGKADSDYRYRAGAVIASSRRVLLINKRTTGVVFFTGLAHPQHKFGSVMVFERGLRSAEQRLDGTSLHQILDDPEDGA